MPMNPAWKVYSLFSLFPLRNFKSNTPDNALPYSAENAPVIKSEFDKSWLLRIEIPPPDVAGAAKWLGLGISTPSILHNRPNGELPRIEILLFPSSVLCTPANDKAILPGSLIAAANFCVSSTLNVRVLVPLMLFTASCLSLSATISTPFIAVMSSSRGMVNTISFPLLISRFWMVPVLYPVYWMINVCDPMGTFTMRNCPSISVTAPISGSVPYTMTFTPGKGCDERLSITTPRTVWVSCWANKIVEQKVKKTSAIARNRFKGFMKKILSSYWCAAKPPYINKTPNSPNTLTQKRK